MQGRHVLILRKNYILGIVHLVANEQAVVFVAWSKAFWHKEPRKTIDDFRFHVAMGIVAHQPSLVQVVGSLDYGFLHRSVFCQKEMGVVLALGKERES